MQKIRRLLINPFVALPLVWFSTYLYCFVKSYGDGWRMFELGLLSGQMYLAWIIYSKASFVHTLKKFGWWCLLQVTIINVIQYAYLYIFNDFSLPPEMQAEWGNTIAKAAMARKTSYFFYLLPFVMIWTFAVKALYQSKKESDTYDENGHYLAFLRPYRVKGLFTYMLFSKGSIAFIVKGKQYLYDYKAKGFIKRDFKSSTQSWILKKVDFSEKQIRFLEKNVNSRYIFMIKDCVTDYVFRLRLPLKNLFF
jgi:hypothetical protein